MITTAVAAVNHVITIAVANLIQIIVGGIHECPYRDFVYQNNRLTNTTLKIMPVRSAKRADFTV